MTHWRSLDRTHGSRPIQSAALSGFILVSLLNAGHVFAQDDAPRQLGKVEVLSGPVQCADGTCYEIRVTCPEVAAPARARLKVAAPLTTSARGTMSGAGFRIVQLQWIDSWLVAAPGKEEGHVRLGCRPATVARWVYDHLHEPATSSAFCATGNSGGAAQVSYMLSHYGLKDILAAVVPTGGPPMGRLDRACDPDDPAYIRDAAMRKLNSRPWRGSRRTCSQSVGCRDHSRRPAQRVSFPEAIRGTCCP